MGRLGDWEIGKEFSFSGVFLFCNSTIVKLSLSKPIGKEFSFYKDFDRLSLTVVLGDGVMGRLGVLVIGRLERSFVFQEFFYFVIPLLSS
jgi:hypothetical protein